jgi:glutamyl-tRNA(Gln) amidotransferase subunit E
MNERFDPKQNYETTRQVIGYVSRKEATQTTYDTIGFMSGLEVHQQLRTQKKLFCRCPAGVYHENDDYDAEIVRHMRPTLSELGEYDGTALMEFKTKKEIIYRIKNETTCTYEVDDTPPFVVNREALEIAIEISLLSKLNIVGEVHITRKQYLDGSIPTGFQRTTIIGVEGEIPLNHKKIRLIQLSLEEDSCREISDIGHRRIYKTDRLGMPLIETVTYPDMANPDEVMEACNYIRFLNRSTGHVRTGMGASRQDVNVSCRGGSRVEIKGVAHTKWIPELTHNECFRQWALLHIRQLLMERVPQPKQWKTSHVSLNDHDLHFPDASIKDAFENKYPVVAVNVPNCKGILSHFTQPGKMFADELSDRLKVIACIEKPNMIHSEELERKISQDDLSKIRSLLKSGDADAQIILWGPASDIPTAMETIEERCRMAFTGVPNETRKSFPDGTTIFERVLPGADRMYPDTDSAPIPLQDETIQHLREHLPGDVIARYHQMRTWNIPEDNYTFIFKKNLFPIIERIVNELGQNPRFTGVFFGQNLKYVEGHFSRSADFSYERIYDLFRYVKDQGIDIQYITEMLPVVYQHPKMDFDSVLVNLKFKRVSKAEIISQVPFLKEKFVLSPKCKNPRARTDWIMGGLRKMALGNLALNALYKHIEPLP